MNGFDENQQSKYWKAFNLKIRGLLEKTISLIRRCSICISRKNLLNLQKHVVGQIRNSITMLKLRPVRYYGKKICMTLTIPFHKNIF